MTDAQTTVDLLLDDITPQGFYLAAFHHKSPGAVLWWGPESRGYTPDLEQAGVYSYDEACRIERGDCAVPVPAAMIDSLRVRRIVDPGDALNIAFRSAASLRHHMARAGWWIPMLPPDATQQGDRRKLIELLRDLHKDGVLSEQQCAQRMGVDLVTWRTIKDEAK